MYFAPMLLWQQVIVELLSSGCTYQSLGRVPMQTMLCDSLQACTAVTGSN